MQCAPVLFWFHLNVYCSLRSSIVWDLSSCAEFKITVSRKRWGVRDYEWLRLRPEYSEYVQSSNSAQRHLFDQKLAIVINSCQLEMGVERFKCKIGWAIHLALHWVYCLFHFSYSTAWLELTAFILNMIERQRHFAILTTDGSTTCHRLVRSLPMVWAYSFSPQMPFYFGLRKVYLFNSNIRNGRNGRSD